MVSNVMTAFVREMIGGVSNVLLNNPMLSWENGFIKIIAAICALIAISNIIMSLNNQQQFAEKSLRFLFMLMILFMNFGVINPRTFFPFNLGQYEYINRSTVDSSVNKFLTTELTKPIPTLDRDIYNTLAKIFDDLASSIGSIAGNEQTSMDENGTVSKDDKIDLQTQAIYNTLYFLTQVKVGRLACNNNGNTSQYVECLKMFIPYEAELSADGTQSAPKCAGGDCGIAGAKQVEQGSSTGSDSGWGAIVGGITSAGAGIGKLVTLIMSAYGFFYMLFTDFAFIVGLPLILWLVELARNIITLYFVIRYGFQASLLLMFAKIMSPLILIESKFNDVKEAYMMVFSTALFGFMSQLFVLAATVLSIGLHSATYSVIAPLIYNSGSSVQDSAQLTADIYGMVYLVYFAIIVIMLLQIFAMTKIDKACSAFLSFSVKGFVQIGSELAGSAVNIGLMAAGALVAAPVALAAMKAGGAAAAVGSIAGKGMGGAASLASKGFSAANKFTGGGMGRMASKIGNSGFGQKVGRMGSSMAETGRGMARNGVNSAVNGAEYLFGDEVGAKARHMFGPGGSSKKSSGSVIAAPDSKTGQGKDEIENQSEETSAKTEDAAGAGKSTTTKAGASGGKVSRSSTNGGGGSSSGAGKESAAEASDDNPYKAAIDKAERAKKQNPYKGTRKLPKFFDHPAIKAGLMASNIIGGISKAATGSGNIIGDGMKGFKGGLGSTITGGFEKASDSMSSILDGAYLDDGFREKVVNFNRSIDNVDESERAESAINLQESIGSAVDVQELDETSTNPEVLASVNEFNALQQKMDSEEGLSSEEQTKLANLSNQYKLNESQSGKLNAYSAQNKDYQKLLESRKEAEKKKVEAYMKNSNSDNASSLTDSIKSGEISRQALENKALQEKIAKVKNNNVSALNQKLSSVDKSKLDDEQYKATPDVKDALRQANSFGSDKNMQLSLMSDNSNVNDLAVNLKELGVLDKNYAEGLMNMKSQEELKSVVSSFPETIKMFKTGKAFTENGFLHMGKDGEMSSIVGSTKDFAAKGISINKIKDSGLKNLLIKQKEALQVLRNNPELAEAYGAKFEELAIIMDYLSF